MRVAAPADRRFRRAQIAPAKRRRRPGLAPRAAAAGAICAVAAYAFYRAAVLVLSIDALTISQITVSGNNRMSRGEVVALLEDSQGANMVLADLEAWRAKLLGSPWVADAALRRVLPGTLAVAIAEREPMCVARIGASLYLVDRTGTIIDEFGPNYEDLDLPIVDGLAAPPDEGGPIIDAGRAELASRLLADLQRRPAIARLVSQVEVSDGRGAAVILKGDTALVTVGQEGFADRIQSYLDLRPALRERVPAIDYVDLRFGERIYVRPHGKARAQGSGLRPRTRRSGG
jgi:cell division protein FtsQ